MAYSRGSTDDASREQMRSRETRGTVCRPATDSGYPSSGAEAARVLRMQYRHHDRRSLRVERRRLTGVGFRLVSFHRAEAETAVVDRARASRCRRSRVCRLRRAAAGVAGACSPHAGRAGRAIPAERAHDPQLRARCRGQEAAGRLAAAAGCRTRSGCCGAGDPRGGGTRCADPGPAVRAGRCRGPSDGVAPVGGRRPFDATASVTTAPAHREGRRPRCAGGRAGSDRHRGHCDRRHGGDRQDRTRGPPANDGDTTEREGRR
jgi:hypothetical protein